VLLLVSGDLKRRVQALEEAKQQSTSQGTTSHSSGGVAKGTQKVKRSKSADRMMACRFEMKYLVSESKAAAMTQFMKPYIPMDRYCKLQRGGDYPIVSLYIDSEKLRLCRESLEGHQNRFKLRIRSYTDEPDYPCFFEIKRRINTVIMKSRARVMPRDVPGLLEGLPLPPQNYNVDLKALSQFQLYAASIRARPTILIRYLRQAYEGEGEGRVRVTFDRRLCYKVTHKPEVRLGGPGWQPNPFTVGQVILEIKFTGQFPPWLNRMVKYFDLKARAISKYASSIEDSCLLRFCAPQLTA